MPVHFQFGSNFYLPDEIHGESETAYILDDYINQGGNAVVFKCIQQDSGDELAIKFLLATRERDIQRFQQEIEILSNIEHDHIVKYIDHGSVSLPYTKGRRKFDHISQFIVMELANTDLKNYLQSKNFSIGSAEYLGQIRGLSSALSKLHTRAIHRDIKPGNILVCGERWVLTDFGLCSQPDEALNLTRANEAVGPRYWMSPEANNKVLGIGTDINKSSDVFQLASVFWLIINGFHPTGVLQREDWLGPEPLFKVIHDSLHYDKNIRPQNGHSFYENISRAISEL